MSGINIGTQILEMIKIEPMEKKMKILIIIVLFFAAIQVFAQDSQFRTIENNSFDVGERLTFDVKYGFITAGVAEMYIPKIRRIAGRDVYHVTFKVNSLPGFDPFYKVRDRYETYIDVEGLFPWRFEQHIREGGFSMDFSAFFDQRRGKVKTSDGSYEIPRYVNDIVSAFYYFRTQDFSNLEIGDKLHLENFYRDTVYPLDVKYLGKETVQVEAGEFDCIILQPIIEAGGLFKSEGNIIVWLSDDELKIPVKVKTKILIGSIDAELTKYEGLKGQPVSQQ